MATHRTIAATETDPLAPLVAALFKALADNPLAIAEGAIGAPRILIGALERLNPGVQTRSTGQTFDFMQSGTIRYVFTQSVSTGTQTVEVRRTRNGVTTAVATYSSGPGTVVRTTDVAVLPGDRITSVITGTGGGTGSINTFLFRTNGENLWPGVLAQVDGNIFL